MDSVAAISITLTCKIALGKPLRNGSICNMSLLNVAFELVI